ERAAQAERLQAAIASQEALLPQLRDLGTALQAALAAIGERKSAFDAALAADQEAGEHVAEELRACAREEALLHTELHSCNETLTEAEVALQRARDQVAEAEHEVEQLATRLELDAAPADEPLEAEAREALIQRVDRLARRREQLGPVNPLAQDEYADAVAHVEELEQQREDLETALRELERLISDTDRQIRQTFEATFEAAARNFQELSTQLFPGGSGRLRLVTEREGAPRVLGGQESLTDEDPVEEFESPEEDRLGVEIEITPAGKDMKRLTLLSGGEKSMTALAF